MKKDQSTEGKILEAARKVFEKKGMTGARMQEIADAAGINKALLHYYFRSKEKLFDKILHDAISKGLPALVRILNEDTPLFEKIRQYVEGYITIISKNEFLPAFIIHEMNRNPGKLLAFIQTLEDRPNPKKFFRQVEVEVKAGRIHPIRPEHLMVNMLSMSVFPFLIQPMLVKGLGFDKKYFDKLIEERKTLVADFIINAIKK